VKPHGHEVLESSDFVRPGVSHQSGLAAVRQSIDQRTAVKPSLDHRISAAVRRLRVLHRFFIGQTSGPTLATRSSTVARSSTGRDDRRSRIRSCPRRSGYRGARDCRDQAPGGRIRGPRLARCRVLFHRRSAAAMYLAARTRSRYARESRTPPIRSRRADQIRAIGPQTKTDTSCGCAFTVNGAPTTATRQNASRWSVMAILRPA